MDDGYFYNNTVILCSDSYTYEEILLLIHMLETNFKLKANIIKRSANS